MSRRPNTEDAMDTLQILRWMRISGLIAAISLAIPLLIFPGSAKADTIGQYMTTTGSVVKFSTDKEGKLKVMASGLRPELVPGTPSYCWFRATGNDEMYVANNGQNAKVASDGTFSDVIGPLPGNRKYTAYFSCTAQTDAQLAETTEPNGRFFFPMTDPSGVPVELTGSGGTGVPSSPHKAPKDSLKWLKKTGDFATCLGVVGLFALPIAFGGVIGGSSTALAWAAKIARIPGMTMKFNTAVSPCMRSVFNIDMADTVS